MWVHILAERSHRQQKWHLGPPVLPAQCVSRQTVHQTQHPRPGASHEVNQHNVLDIGGLYMAQYCTRLWQHKIGNIVRITENRPTSSPHSLACE